MVAPISVTDPSSTTGRKLSCCERLKRWISSTNSNVPWPAARRARAASKTFLSSATPVKIAEIWTKVNVVSCARRRATVVLPEPGGPQKISDPIAFARSIRVSAPSGPSKWSWPATSLRRRGRNLSASGRGASFSRPAARNRSLTFAPATNFSGKIIACACAPPQRAPIPRRAEAKKLGARLPFEGRY